jgi:RimJ/RimL family protein N-acetyltransferase
MRIGTPRKTAFRAWMKRRKEGESEEQEITMGQSAPQHHHFRHLWPSDRQAFLDHLKRLDAPSRYDRFGGVVSDAFLERYAANSFHHDDVVYGGFIDGVLHAAGELRAISPSFGFADHGTAEAALSVETPHRRRGIGGALLARVMRAATNRGVNRVQVFCLAHNEAMQALARKVEAQLRLEHETVAGDLLTLAPTPMTLWREAADHVMDGFGAIAGWQAKLYAPAGRAKPGG